jgi:hypothetical protein
MIKARLRRANRGYSMSMALNKGERVGSWDK